MSKSKKLRKRLTKFVNSLGPDEAREQLLLAYLQMERCRQVLRGEDVEPVTMADNGESSDLELFYQCKKVAEELDYLNNELGYSDKEDVCDDLEMHIISFGLGESKWVSKRKG